jgi:prophage regulatory protein
VLRQKQVLALLGISSSTLWAWVKAGRMPRPIELGPNSRAWLEHEIDQMVFERAKERDQPESAPARKRGPK